MNEIIPSSPVPLPALPIAVRVGTRDDIPFIDALQKKYGKALGFFPRAQLEGYIDHGWVLIAVGATLASPADAQLPTIAQTVAAGDASVAPTEERLGYVLSRDRYLKRDELGVIYQLCVSPSAQRGLIGATLIREVFERSAYGCRLYCCWCAQDLAANRFWESLGFQAIAYRTGGTRGKGHGTRGKAKINSELVPCPSSHVPSPRVHIFWQKRIRANDASTPWWFPAKTEGGAMREDRLVLPIPPGLQWDDAMPVMVAAGREEIRRVGTAHRLPGTRKLHRDGGQCPPYGKKPPAKMSRPKMRWGPPGVDVCAKEIVEEVIESTVPVKREKTKRVASKVDPKLIAAARELRDRYLEQVNSGAPEMPAIGGKYDVSRTLSAVEGSKAIESRKTVELIEPTTAKLLAA